MIGLPAQVGNRIENVAALRSISLPRMSRSIKQHAPLDIARASL